jgi:iron complex transport system ATP-binding protein
MELLAARAEAGCAMVVALHDIGLAARFCTRMVLIAGGRILADGPPDAVLSDALLAQSHSITVHRAERERAPIIVPWARL